MATKELTDSQCIYYDFQLQIIGETETSFIIGNAGESVGDSADINTQFMLIKDTLGFEQTGFGCFQKSISKFEDQLQLEATKLITQQTWLIRVLREDANNYLLQVSSHTPNSAAPNSINWVESGWQRHADSYLKWVSKSEVTEIMPFITYWGARPS